MSCHRQAEWPDEAAAPARPPSQRHREGVPAPVAIQERRLDCFVAALLAMTVPSAASKSLFLDLGQDRRGGGGHRMPIAAL